MSGVREVYIIGDSYVHWLQKYMNDNVSMQVF